MNKNIHLDTPYQLKLVAGSHIIVPRIYQDEHAFILQNHDRRVIFVYPYEQRYTLIGTTDVEYSGDPGKCVATAAEIEYLCRAANRYFARSITPSDVVWSYCGVRPLFDDGAQNISEITRDYTLRVEGDQHTAPLLSVFGGKITTYRKLAEHALAQLAPWFAHMKHAWTDKAALPGGAMNGKSLAQYVAQLTAERPQLPGELLHALVSRHGDATAAVLGEAQTPADLGQHFGHTLYAREVDYFITHEWARSADDVLWRRTKCGLHLNSLQKQMLEEYVTIRQPTAVRQ